MSEQIFWQTLILDIMKKHLRKLSAFLLGIGCLISFQSSHAQVSFGTAQAVLQGETEMSLGGLTLTPDSDLRLTNKTLQTSADAIMGSPTNSISRVYIFNETFNFQGTVGIHYLPSELNGNVEVNLQIAKSGNTNGPYTTTSGSTVSLVNHYVSNTVNTDLRVISAVAAQSALPVTLISFTASKENQAALLRWSTSFETNADYFEVQQSLNGKTWQNIGHVPAKGESTSRAMYSFNALNQPAGENLYRLQMVDNNKSYAYSNVRSVTFENILNAVIFPNPATDRFQISVSDWGKIDNIQIINADGQVNLKIGKSDLAAFQAKGLDVKALRTGIYIVKIIYTNGITQSLKLLKN